MNATVAEKPRYYAHATGSTKDDSYQAVIKDRLTGRVVVNADSIDHADEGASQLNAAPLSRIAQREESALLEAWAEGKRAALAER